MNVLLIIWNRVYIRFRRAACVWHAALFCAIRLKMDVWVYRDFLVLETQKMRLLGTKLKEKTGHKWVRGETFFV